MRKMPSLRREVEAMEWSERFFHWQLECYDNSANLIQAAEAFRRLHPNCPKRFDAEWLCLQYQSMV